MFSQTKIYSFKVIYFSACFVFSQFTPDISKVSLKLFLSFQMASC